MANKANGYTDAQASYFQVTDNGLVHPTNINLPANRLIVLTIQAFDMGNLTVNPQFLKVNGTINNQITLVNQTMAMMDDYSMSWQQDVTSVPASEILHTFTIQQLNINIPVIAGFTEIAYLTIHKTGTFGWICEAPCGNGAMDTAGWMFGQVTVS